MTSQDTNSDESDRRFFLANKIRHVQKKIGLSKLLWTALLFYIDIVSLKLITQCNSSISWIDLINKTTSEV
ncbi:Uncharacterised protein [Sphingobacterium multivorum]|uniref:Uncharacterized protein n=1 Tax=Sphingobacterium multivorum TaxID=28454 RepID=A0A2X2J3M7_SPHMU|nr:Uncharacterised protein [Sphingobacterium multivorum]